MGIGWSSNHGGQTCELSFHGGFSWSLIVGSVVWS